MKLCRSCRESLQISFLLLSCSVTVLCQKIVTGIEGQPITLPCSYKVRRSSDLTSMCWGRGSCPNSKCNQELIWTDGQKVTFQSSSRYQLKEKIRQGIVSLTIAEAKLEDAGTYCCRIEHQGWFNDEKINIRLTVEKAPTTVRTTTLAPTTMKTTPAPTTMKTTPAPTTIKTTEAPPSLKTTLAPPLVQTTPEPSHIWTNPSTTSVKGTTQPPPSVTINTSPPPAIRTEAPSSSTARTIISSPNVSPADMTEHKELTPRSSDIPRFYPDYEPTRSAKSEDEDHTLPTLWPESLSPDNDGISDLFQGNVTAPPRKDISTIIIAVSLSVITLIVILVILLQLKVQKRGRYLLGMDPHLELVTHAENPMMDIQGEAKDSNTAEEEKAKTNHTENLGDSKD